MFHTFLELECAKNQNFILKSAYFVASVFKKICYFKMYIYTLLLLLFIIIIFLYVYRYF